MKHAMFIYLLVILAVGLTVQSYAQDGQGDGGGMGFQGLRSAAIYPYRTNSAAIKMDRRIKRDKVLTGVRRLVPQEYPSIQAAIDASADGDTVLVSDGIYVENIRFHGKAIVVASLYLVDGDTSHIEQTIIDGSNPSHPDSASTVYFIGGEDTTSVLCGFTIQGGVGTLWTSTTGIIWRSGGGIYCDSAYGATIVHNRIMENQVSGEYAAGGGVDFVGEQGFLILEGNRIFRNGVSANPGTGLGGGVSIAGSGVNTRIVENIFERDTVVAQGFSVGGAVYIQGFDTPAGGVIRGNVFRGNIADATSGNGLGGGAFIWATSEMEIRNNIFENNLAKSRNAYAEGGALLIDDEPPASGYGRKMVTGNRFINNLSNTQFGNFGSGGGLELFRTLATVSGNYFEQNTTQGGTPRGGAIRIASSEFRLENNIFTENTSLLGGAVYVSGTPQAGAEADLDIINNTMVNNTASSSGGGVRVGSISSAVQVTVLNSILWENTPNQIAQTSGGSVAVLYSDIQGGWTGEGNIDVNPFFADTVDYQLSDSSQCIGAGIDSIEIGGVWYHSPPTDMGGNPRPNPTGSMPDMGAWESPLGNPGSIIHVPGNYPTIQAAIDAATDGNTVLVADGIYYENINFKGKAITVASHYIIDGDTSHIANTIIDGSQPSHPDSGSVVYFISGEDTNSVLCGFTITGGNGTIIQGDRAGGGIYAIFGGARVCNNIIENNSVISDGQSIGAGVSSFPYFVIIENNIIRNNYSESSSRSAWGGGVFLQSDGRIIGNKISGNEVTDAGLATSFVSYGGGVSCFWPSGGSIFVTIHNNIITNNKSTRNNAAYGGGLSLIRTESDLSNNTISDNTASTLGGGIYVNDSSPYIKNNLIVGNEAASGGGIRIFTPTVIANPEPGDEGKFPDAAFGDTFKGIPTELIPQTGRTAFNKPFFSEPQIINNTISANAASSLGGGIYSTNSQVVLMNSILWGDIAPTGPEIYVSGGSIDVSYSDVQGGWSGTGNINFNPEFSDTVNYYLTGPSSPAIDAGNPDPAYNDPEDPNNPGNPCWPALGTMLNDMGAYGGPGVICSDSIMVGIDDKSPVSIPQAFALSQNYPNPFNPSTTIEFALSEAAKVKLTVYNMLGQEVATLVKERLSAGRHQATWQADKMPSGVYFYRLSNSPLRSGARGDVQTRKMLLIQ